MPAVSKAQQRFFGMVRATQKGEMASPSPEVAKAATSMSKSDVKKFAKTKHDKLPEKKETKESFAIDPKEHRKNQRLAKIRNLAKKGATEGERSAAERKTKGPKMFGEAYYGGEEQRKKDQKKAAYEKQLKRMLPKRAFDQMGREIDPRSGKLKEESNPRIPRKKGQPANSKKHSDLYTDENPKGTIHGLGFKDVATAKASVAKIKKSSRSHAHKIQAAVAMEQRAREMGKSSEAAVYRKFINMMKKKTKKMNEGWSDKYKKSIDCNNPKGFSQRAHCQGKKKVSEATKYDRYDKEKKQFAKADRKMKFGKFYDKAKEAKDRLRPGEVKRYDKKLGRYVSNKD